MLPSLSGVAAKHIRETALLCLWCFRDQPISIVAVVAMTSGAVSSILGRYPLQAPLRFTINYKVFFWTQAIFRISCSELLSRNVKTSCCGEYVRLYRNLLLRTMAHFLQRLTIRKISRVSILSEYSQSSSSLILLDALFFAQDDRMLSGMLTGRIAVASTRCSGLFNSAGHSQLV